MKVILFIIGDMNIGGAEKQLFELISNLDKEKFKPILLCMNSFGYYAELLKKEYKIDTLFLNSKKSMDFKRLFYIRRIIKKEKVDLVHSWRYEANMYVGIIKLILPNLKWVSTERSAGPTNANSRIKIIEKFIMQKSNIIITNSKAGINYLNKILNIKNEKICLIHNGLRKNDDKKTEIRREYNFSNNDFIISYIANFHSYKNHLLLVKSVQKILKTNNNIRLICFGDGDRFQYIKNYIVDNGLQNHIILKGKVENPKKYLFDIDIMVHVSRHEGLSNSILEGMSAGLPIIAFDVGGNSELVQNNVNGILIDQIDIVALTKSIKKLMYKSSLIKKMGAKSKLLVKNNHSIKKMVKRTMEVYINQIEK